MSSLNMADRHNLEKLLGMEGGYVLNFSDSTFGQFLFEAVGVDIHSARYTPDGTSKARKLRAFWKLESDYLVGKLILALVDYSVSLNSEPAQVAIYDEVTANIYECQSCPSDFGKQLG